MQLGAEVSRHDEGIVFRENVAVIVDSASSIPNVDRKCVPIGLVQVAVFGFKAGLVEDVVGRRSPISS